MAKGSTVEKVSEEKVVEIKAAEIIGEEVKAIEEKVTDEKITNGNGLTEVVLTVEDEPDQEYKIILKWKNIIAFIYLHIFSIVALIYPPQVLSTYIIQFWLLVTIGFGTTVGSHRLFTHRTYRA